MAFRGKLAVTQLFGVGKPLGFFGSQISMDDTVTEKIPRNLLIQNICHKTHGGAPLHWGCLKPRIFVYILVHQDDLTLSGFLRIPWLNLSFKPPAFSWENRTTQGNNEKVSPFSKELNHSSPSSNWNSRGNSLENFPEKKRNVRLVGADMRC